MSNLSELKSNIDNLDIADMNELFLYLASKDKDNSDILSSLVSKLSSSIPELTNISEASKVKRLLKLFSLMIYEYNHLTYDEFYNNFFLHSASGEFLDEYAKEVGVDRDIMHKARGTLRVGSSEEVFSAVTLPLFFTVSTEETGSGPALKYRVLQQATISPSAEKEVYINFKDNPDGEEDGYVYWADADVTIEAEEGGEHYNIEENKIIEILTKVQPFDRIAQVGKVDGGYDRESDASLKRRILEERKSDFELSESWLINTTKDNFPEVEDISVVRTPSPHGLGTVGLNIKTNGNTPEEQNLIKHEVQKFWDSTDIKMLEFKVFVELVETVELDIAINLYYTDTSQINLSDFLEVTNAYFSKLSMGEPFIKEYFEREIADLCESQGIKYFETISPSYSIRDDISDRQLFVLGKANFIKKEYVRG